MTKYIAARGEMSVIDGSDAINAASDRSNDEGRAIERWDASSEDDSCDTVVDLAELRMLCKSRFWEMEYDADDAGLATHTIADVFDVVDVTMNGDD
jgi:hypothetical protein